MTLQTCPCRKTASAPLSFADCCQPILEGRAKAPTAEALMRARYSAFAVGTIDFLVESVAPEAREGMERGSLEAWSRESEWLGLDIVDTVDGGPDDAKGVVEFVAHYARGGTREAHHERSTFRQGAPGDGWYFVDGEKPRGKTVVKGAQPGRNDPCSCGSGKKYKKCCGAAA